MEKEILNRINVLRDVFAWSLENGGLTSGQRICLSQERSGHMKKLEALRNNVPCYPTYTIPDRLEDKVQHILRVIKNTNWQKQEINY